MFWTFQNRPVIKIGSFLKAARWLISIFHIRAFWSCFTLSEEIHCFQPARRPYRIQAAARGASRWHSWASTAQWHTPSCPPTPSCHCFVLPSWNPVRWACDGLRDNKKGGGVNSEKQQLSVADLWHLLWLPSCKHRYYIMWLVRLLPCLNFLVFYMF